MRADLHIRSVDDQSIATLDTIKNEVIEYATIGIDKPDYRPSRQSALKLAMIRMQRLCQSIVTKADVQRLAGCYTLDELNDRLMQMECEKQRSQKP